MRNVVIVETLYALRHIQALLGPRKCHIKLAGILGKLSRIVATIIVGDASVNGIKHNDVVKLQALCLMYGCYEYMLVDATAATEVGLLSND